jgi:hypothetical protein
MAKFPKEPMSATPPDSESDSEPEKIPRDSIPAPDSIANESVLANLSTGDNIWKQGEDIVNRFRDAAADFSEKVRDNLTMAEVIQQISKGYVRCILAVYLELLLIGEQVFY